MNDEILLGFSTTGVWLSRLIRWATRAKYSHCWVRHGSEVWGGLWVTQADWPVVRTWPWRAASRSWTVKKLYRPRFDIHPALARVRRDFEDPYDIAGLFGMVLVTIMLKWFKRRIKNPLASPSGVFCSEFVAKILVEAKLPGTEHWDPQGMTPKQVEAYCAKHDELFEVLAEHNHRPNQTPIEPPDQVLAAGG